MAAYQTKQRRILQSFLADHPDESLSAADIAAALSAQSISISAVYRNLTALEQEGRVRRVAKSGSREVLYQFVDTEDCREHLHLLCKGCGATYHMNKEDADSIIRMLAVHEQFAVDRNDTVLYGTCEACQIKERIRTNHGRDQEQKSTE